MKLTLPTLATAFAVVAADTAPDSHGKSYLPSTYVHNMGMKALAKARSDVLRRAKADRKLLRTSSNRKMMVDDRSDILGDDLDNMDFESLMGDVMDDMPKFLCAALEFGQDLAAEFEVDLESGIDIDSDNDGVDDVNVACEEIGCDDPDAEVPNLIMKCNMDGEVCEEYDGVEYCATNASIDHKMSLNFEGISNIEATQCNDFTAPVYLAEAGRVCVTISATVDYSSMLNFDMDWTETEDVDDAGLDDFFQITSCSSTSDGGQVECECGICNDGMGFELKCGDLISEECTNYDTTEVGAVAEGGSETPSVAVLRLIELPNTGGDGVTVVSDIDAEGSTDSGATDEPGNDLETETGDGSSPDAETKVDGENSEAGDSDETDAVAGTESTPETAADEGSDNPDTSATGDAGSGTTNGDNVGSNTDLPIPETGDDVTDIEGGNDITDEDVVPKADSNDDTSPAASCSGLVAAGLALVFASSLSLV